MLYPDFNVCPLFYYSLVLFILYFLQCLVYFKDSMNFNWINVFSCYHQVYLSLAWIIEYENYKWLYIPGAQFSKLDNRQAFFLGWNIASEITQMARVTPGPLMPCWWSFRLGPSQAKIKVIKELILISWVFPPGSDTLSHTWKSHCWHYLLNWSEHPTQGVSVQLVLIILQHLTRKLLSRIKQIPIKANPASKKTALENFYSKQFQKGPNILQKI